MAQQQTKEKPAENKQLAPIDHVAPSRLPITQAMQQKMGVDDAMWRVLTDQIFLSARTVEGIKLALDYCRARNLDIMTKPVHVVSTYSSLLKKYVETVWSGIGLLRITAARTGLYQGIDDAEFGPMIEREFIDHYEDDRDPRQNRDIKQTVKYPEWCRMTVYKYVKGERCAFTAKVYWTEIYATAGRNTEMPNEMWRKRPIGQLEKCTEAAALRRAFPEELGGQYTADEMEGKVIDHDDIRPLAVTASRNPAGATIPSAQGGVRGAAPTTGQPPVGAAPTDAKPSNEAAKINVPAETTVEDLGEEEPFDFDAFEAKVMEAADEAGINAVCESRQFDIYNRFIDDAHNMQIALKIKQARLRQIRQPEGATNG